MSDKRKVKLNELIARRDENRVKVKALFDKGDQNGGNDSAEDLATIKSLNTETKSLMEQIEELKSLIGIREDANSDAGQGSPQNLPGHSNGDPGQRRVKSLGEAFVEDPTFKAWLKANPNMGVIGRELIQSPRVGVGSFFKTLVTAAGATSAAPFIWEDQKRDLVDEFFKRPLTVRDLITIGRTDSDTVEYVRVTGITNAAAGVAEATSAGVSEVGRKPESAIATERVSESVKTIAHWIPATSRSLQDAGQLQTLINTMLMYGIQEQLEDEILLGTGGDGFTGILETANIQTQAFSTDLKTTARKARTLVRLNGRTFPTAYLLHPNDVETLDLDQNDLGVFYWGGPQMISQNRTLWGVPVVECEAITEGVGLLGDFKLAFLWDRMQSAISSSNSHSDFFTKNLVAILAEMRACFGVIRPQAFCSFEAVSGGS